MRRLPALNTLLSTRRQRSPILRRSCDGTASIFSSRGRRSLLIPVLEHIRGLIFDCDGTLVDSMPLHMKAWEETVQSFGANFDPEFFFPKKGMRDTDIVAQFNLQFGKSLNSADAVRVKDSFFLQHVDGVKPLRLVVDVVR